MRVQRVCSCGKNYSARQADLDRGWGKSCSKSCAAKRRERSGTPSPAQLRQRRKWAEANGALLDYEAQGMSRTEARDHLAGLDAMEAGWDGHKIWNQ